jgi:hypothetical protein
MKMHEFPRLIPIVGLVFARLLVDIESPLGTSVKITGLYA